MLTLNPKPLRLYKIELHHLPASASGHLVPCCPDVMMSSDWIAWKRKQFKSPWPNGQGVGLLIQRLWVQVPQGIFLPASAHSEASTNWTLIDPILDFVQPVFSSPVGRPSDCRLCAEIRWCLVQFCLDSQARRSFTFNISLEFQFWSEELRLLE